MKNLSLDLPGTALEPTKYSARITFLCLPLLFFSYGSLSFAGTSAIVGCPTGTAFNDPTAANQVLTSVKLSASDKLYNIQGIANTGTLPAHGGPGGTAATASWPANEYLVRTYGTYNASYVGQISFVTNTGRVLGPYGKPNYPYVWKKTGTILFIPIYKWVQDFSTFDYTVPASNAIAGFSGRASNYIAAIGVNYNSLPAPDLAVSIAQPAPNLVETALSELPVTISNNGGSTAASPITLTLPLPTGISAPLKFARNADAWLCYNIASKLSCTYSKAIPAGGSTTIRLPITPQANSKGKVPSAFVATVAAVSGEINTANNNSPALNVTTPVVALNLPGVVDPTYSAPVLNPTAIPKYALPLPNLLAPFYRHTPDTKTFPGTDFYTLTINQVPAQVLPPGFPATQVYAYGDPKRPDTFTYPAHSIIAYSVAAGLNSLGLGKPVKVKYLDNRNPNLAHLLPIDHSIHGAMAGEPDIRSIAHLHGNKRVNQNSDGYSEAWTSPNGKNGAQFSVTTPSVPVNPNPFDYTNDQEATLLWYHDHTLGMTRSNVYSGMAGAYALLDSNELTMINNKSLPDIAYEIPLVIQDRMFHPDGSLAYPDKNPTVPTSPTVSMLPEFFGNVMVVNGAAWPFLEVEPRKYRFRILNGSNSRFYDMRLSNNASFQVIGTEGGFLAAPATVSNLLVGPAERYDVIVDFSAANGQTITLTNSANAPYPGDPANPTVTPGLDDQIMQFRVNQPLSALPNNPLPTSLRPGGVPAITPTVAAPRQVLLAETTDNNGRVLPILGTVKNGILGWMDTLTETPKAGSIETWEIYNSTNDAHPIHLHGGHFQIVNRQPYLATQTVNLGLTGITFPGAAVIPGAQEKTWKDTVISYPGQVTRITVKFENNKGLYVWHCHIVEHEDHDMMRPMLIQ